MNNSTSSSPKCVSSFDFRPTRDNANYFAYSILPYPYLVLGILGHARMLRVSYKQAKTDSGYLLQTFFAVVRIFEIVCFMMLIFGFNTWAVASGTAAHWYRSNFALMWFAAHLIIPLVNGFINTSMLMTLCISIDRVLSLWKPEAYREKWYRTRYRVGALIICLIIGFAVVSYDTGRFYLAYDVEEDVYVLQNDSVYTSSWVGTFFTYFRNFILFGGVIAMIVINAVVFRLYRIRTTDSSANVTIREIPADRSAAYTMKEAKRKEAERTLLMLSVCQSVIATLSMGFMMLMYIFEYTITETYACYGILDVGWPVCDSGLQMAALLDFYVPLAMSKSMRRIVFSVKNTVGFVVVNQNKTGTTQLQPQGNGAIAQQHLIDVE